ncbi:hypothetical protein BCR59_22220 [Klebsiella pneumoniae]|nr:hypothetical protein BCR59_22220 [Klebsiella pneumoniae]
MNPSLPALIARLHAFSGIAHKRDIQQVARELRDAWPNPSPNGDDCALIPDGSGYKLLAIEGFINRFVAEDPWFAGWCGVMVNLSDIAAMGATSSRWRASCATPGPIRLPTAMTAR